jgi:hypothetical protein
VSRALRTCGTCGAAVSRISTGQCHPCANRALGAVRRVTYPKQIPVSYRPKLTGPALATADRAAVAWALTLARRHRDRLSAEIALYERRLDQLDGEDT